MLMSGKGEREGQGMREWKTQREKEKYVVGERKRGKRISERMKQNVRGKKNRDLEL